MATERRRYPFAVYVWVVLCALGVSAIALGIADGWLLAASGAAALSVSLSRLHVLLQRRRAAVDMTPLPLGRTSYSRPQRGSASRRKLRTPS